MKIKHNNTKQHKSDQMEFGAKWSTSTFTQCVPLGLVGDE